MQSGSPHVNKGLVFKMHGFEDSFIGLEPYFFVYPFLAASHAAPGRILKPENPPIRRIFGFQNPTRRSMGHCQKGVYKKVGFQSNKTIFKSMHLEH